MVRRTRPNQGGRIAGSCVQKTPGGTMLKGERVASPSLNVVGEERELLSEQIRNALTDEIASGHLRAGTGLDEQHLADRFGASRTPVREALRQLAAGGLVEM